MIYIFAPAYQVSGGPEALQQMCYYLREIGKESVMVFYNYEEGHNPMPERYKIYGNEWILAKDIEDKDGNAVVVPERRPFYLNPYKKSKRYIWWLSKDNFIFEKASLPKKIKYTIKKLLRINVVSLDTRYCNFNLKDVTHLCGSKYAYDYATQELGLNDVHYCVEPISLEFLRMGPCNSTEGRRNVVLYNPSKPSGIMSELLQRGKFDFIPLKGFTPQELAEIYKTSKLYIDFGAFPGPERMPKEAVFFGCNILVGNRNAAANDFDVAIPEKFKVLGGVDLENIEKKIQNLLARYDNYKAEFYPFITKVINMDKNFIKQLYLIFFEECK